MCVCVCVYVCAYMHVCAFSYVRNLMFVGTCECTYDHTL